MQQKKVTDLAKRSRYYQSLMDSSLLSPGVPNYSELNKSYIIAITTFDPFGYGRYVYTFDARCREEPDCELGDGATRIFINTRGQNDEEISAELKELLQYIENTTDQTAEECSSERIHKIHDRVRKIKISEKVGVKYMQAWEEEYYNRKEAKEEGIQEGVRLKLIQLISKKLRKGKSVEQIADELEEDVEIIQEICEAAEKWAPEYDVQKIYDEVCQ